MGLPVVETGDKWHVNVEQKVPLNRDRDNVKPAYLQAIRVAVLNAAHDLLTADDEATAGWCKLAGADPRCSDEAIKHLIRLRFGEKVAAPDPSDTEAMKTVSIPGWDHRGGLSKGEWANVKRAGAVLPAGQICPTAKPYSRRPERKARRSDSRRSMDARHEEHCSYARFLGQELMGIKSSSQWFARRTTSMPAMARKRLDLNLTLGHRWFDQGATEEVDQLLIHEFGHQYSAAITFPKNTTMPSVVLVPVSNAWYWKSRIRFVSS